MAFQKNQYQEGMAKLNKYSAAFGSSGLLPPSATYVDAMNGFDGRPVLLREMAEKTGLPLMQKDSSGSLQKAPLSVGNLTSGTTDLSLIPIYVDPTIADLTRRLTPLVELIPRVTNYGRTADYNQVTARGVVGWQNEDAALNDAADTYGRQTTNIKYAYQVGRVTGPMLAASRQYLSQQYIDSLNLEVRQKTISMRYTEEDTLINGDKDNSRTAYGGISTVSGAEPDGFVNLVTTNAVNETATPDITIAMLRLAIRRARTANDSTTLGVGDPNLIVTDYTTLDSIKALLQGSQRYVNTNFEIAWGLKTLEFEGLPIIASKFMPSTAAARELHVWSTDTWQMRVLQDVTYEELSKQNDSYKFMIKLYEAPICTAEQFNTRLYNLT